MKRLIMCEGPNELQIMRILLIISEGLLPEFEKVKSSMAPKDFAKQHVKYGGQRYNNSTKFFEDYYG